MALIYYLTHVHLEFGSRSLLAAECERVGIKKPLIVTDAGVRAAGVLQKVLDALPASLQGPVYDGTPSNPTEAAAMYRAHGCDGLIAVGGGSSLDCAKGVAIAATHPGALVTYATIEGGSAKITDAVAPLIAVPTTAGTGSEVAGRDRHHRRPPQARLPLLAPVAALGDLRPGADTGPAAGSDRRHRHGRDRALHGNLHGRAVQPAGRRHRARRPGARLGPYRTRHPRRLGPRGAAEHDERVDRGCDGGGGANPKLHHGTLNAMFLPAVVRFNASAESVVKDKRLARMARAMGLASGSDIPDAIRAMNARLGLPTGLAAMGVAPAMFDRIVSGALADHCHKTNPRIASADEYRALIEESL